MESRMLVDVIDRALLRLKRYPIVENSIMKS